MKKLEMKKLPLTWVAPKNCSTNKGIYLLGGDSTKEKEGPMKGRRYVCMP